MKKCITVFPDIQQRIVIDCIVGVPDIDDPSKDSDSVICKAPRLSMNGKDMIIGMDILSLGNVIIQNEDSKTIFVYERNE